MNQLENYRLISGFHLIKPTSVAIKPTLRNMRNSVQFRLIYPLVILSSFFLFTACNNNGQDQAETKAVETEVNDSSSEASETTAKDRPRIVFFGNSLTAGYGLDEQFSFPSRVQEKVDSAGYEYQVVNAGLSGETTAGGLNRIDWVMEQPISIFVLELGGNDVLRGFDLSATRENLGKILATVKEKYPDVRLVVAGMEAPPNMGQAYTTEFRQIFKDIAQQYEAALIPFLLENVGGIPELNLPDRIHPNQEGQVIVAQNVWDIIEPLLKKAG